MKNQKTFDTKFPRILKIVQISDKKQNKEKRLHKL